MNPFKATILNLIFLLALNTCSITVHAQTWEKIYGGNGIDLARSVWPCTDGGYVFCGDGRSTGRGIYVVKTDLYGDTTWTRSFGDSSAVNYDHGYDVIQCSDGGYALTGQAFSFGAAATSGDAFLIKLDSTGSLQWTKTYPNNGIDIGECLLQTFDNGFIISSAGSYTAAQSNDIFLIKTDANGDTLWTKQYFGYGIVDGKAVVQTSDSGIVMSGYIDTASDTNGVYGITKGLIVLKTDVNGNTLWTKIYPYFRSALNVGQNCISATSDGSFIIAGDIADSVQNSKSYLVKLDANGDSLWSQTYTLQGVINWATSVTSTSDGGIALTGTSNNTFTNSHLYLLKTDSSGTPLWTRYFQPSSLGGDLHETTDHGFILAGSIYQPIKDCYLIKTDSMGNVTSTGLYSPNSITDQFNIYPNPFKDNVFIVMGSAGKTIVTVHNISGQTVFSKKINSEKETEHTIDLGFLQPGVYMMELITENEKMIRKIVKCE